MGISFRLVRLGYIRLRFVLRLFGQPPSIRIAAENLHMKEHRKSDYICFIVASSKFFRNVSDAPISFLRAR